jgi:hypothetical protein
LARWRYFGLGRSAPSSSWREGRDVDQANVRIEVIAETPSLSRCKRGRLKAGVQRLGNEGEISVYADISQPGDASKRVDQGLTPTESSISVDFDMPADAYNVRLGVELRGPAGLELEHLSLTCGEHDRSEIDIERARWLHRGTDTLYSYEVTTCRSKPCLVVRRKPLDTIFDKARDLIEVEISSRLWMHMPLAVWTDGQHTLPEVAAWKPRSIFGPTDLPTRLATLATAWGTMSLFYPYMADLAIDWQRELPSGLVRMASAHSTVEMVWALYRSLVALRDNHVRISHPDFRIDGMLPVALRRFDNTLLVVGAYGDYAKRVPVGTEVLEIDDVSALAAYDEMSARVPSASAGWSTIVIPFWLTLGRLGTFSRLKIKTPDSSVSELVLPHISRALYEFLVQESRPAFGAELSSGVFYIPLEGLKKENWKAMIPSLTTAHAIILDMRGYPTTAVFGILGHFSDTEIMSPNMQYPLLGSKDYETFYWTLRPMRPRLRAKVICLLDGRAVSAAETVLQVIHDHHLATLVGEPSAGTNGNVATVQLPAGFSIRFTGMRVLLRDGTAIQTRGIVPDHVVHPTLEGMRAGRDEVLEVALSLAQRP